MTEDGSSAPRRALGPLPDDDDVPPVGGRFGSRALPDDGPSPTSPDTITGGRGGRFALSPLSPDDPLDVDSSTPVPPPIPVLPDSEAGLAPATGRRYSASMEPGEVVHAAPRRSAATATSPASALEPHLGAVVRPTAPPPVTIPAPTASAPALPPPPRVTAAQGSVNSPTPFSQYPQSVPTAPTAPSDAPTIAPPVTSAANPEPGKATKPPRVRREKKPREKKVRASLPTAAAGSPVADVSAAGVDGPARAGIVRNRSSRPALIVIAAVAAVVLVIAVAVWALTVRSTASSGGPSTSATATAEDPLLTAADLGTLGAATWAEPSAGTSDGQRPICLPATADGLPVAQRSPSKKITSSSSPTDTVVQALDVYADDAAATEAFAVRLVQAGTCADTVALITGANTISGLADSAEVVRLTIQEQTDQFHSLLISRTGRSVSLIDVTTAEELPASDVAAVAATALSRGCGGTLGTCPGSISVATSPPPAGNPFGWLVPADLPRITAGAGRWGATEPKTALDVVGSLCEAINLKTVVGTQTVGQRTLLLADDSNAPQGFGIDQVVYTFADAKGVATLSKKLDKNLTGCPDRAPTASVKEGPAVKGTGTGTGGAKVSGSTYLVTQKTGTETVVFRVAVLGVDTHLVYLLANPSASFDFSDADWVKIAVRAGQRASQGA